MYKVDEAEERIDKFLEVQQKEERVREERAKVGPSHNYFFYLT